MKAKTISIIVCFVILVTACSKVTETSTPDDDLLATQAVATFQSQLTLTQSVIIVPSATNTPEIVKTEMPALTLTPAIPSSTIVTSTGDKAEYISQNPLDGAELGVNQRFDIIFIVKNVGETTWQPDYQLRYHSGRAFAEVYFISFKKEVKPGEEIQLIMDAIAPPDPATYKTNWKLTNSEGVNFYDLSLTIKVVSGNTSTPTPTETTTPTPEK
jgi:hypothetical protein